MGQSFYSAEEIDHLLAEIKGHQRRELLLRIDEILTALDTASPAADQWKSARRSVRQLEGNKLAGIPVSAAPGVISAEL